IETLIVFRSDLFENDIYIGDVKANSRLMCRLRDLEGFMPQDQSERGRLQPSSSPSAANVVLGAECLRLNPSDGTVASRVPAMRAAEARKLANRAALAFLGWSSRPA